MTQERGKKKNCGFPGNAIHSEVSNYLNPSSLSDYNTIPISKNLHPGKKSNLISYQCVVEFNKLWSNLKFKTSRWTPTIVIKYSSAFKRQKLKEKHKIRKGKRKKRQKKCKREKRKQGKEEEEDRIFFFYLQRFHGIGWNIDGFVLKLLEAILDGSE